MMDVEHWQSWVDEKVPMARACWSHSYASLILIGQLLTQRYLLGDVDWSGGVPAKQFAPELFKTDPRDLISQHLPQATPHRKLWRLKTLTPTSSNVAFLAGSCHRSISGLECVCVCVWDVLGCFAALLMAVCLCGRRIRTSCPSTCLNQSTKLTGRQ